MAPGAKCVPSPRRTWEIDRSRPPKIIGRCLREIRSRRRITIRKRKKSRSKRRSGTY